MAQIKLTRFPVDDKMVWGVAEQSGIVTTNFRDKAKKAVRESLSVETDLTVPFEFVFSWTGQVIATIDIGGKAGLADAYGRMFSELLAYNITKELGKA